MPTPIPDAAQVSGEEGAAAGSEGEDVAEAGEKLMAAEIRKWKAPLMSNGMRAPTMLKRGALSKEKAAEEKAGQEEEEQAEKEKEAAAAAAEEKKPKRKVVKATVEEEDVMAPASTKAPAAVKEEVVTPPKPKKMVKPDFAEERKPVLIKKGALKGLDSGNVDVLEDNAKIVDKLKVKVN